MIKDHGMKSKFESQNRDDLDFRDYAAHVSVGNFIGLLTAMDGEVTYFYSQAERCCMKTPQLPPAACNVLQLGDQAAADHRLKGIRRDIKGEAGQQKQA